MKIKINIDRLKNAEITHRAEVPVTINFNRVIGMAKINKEDGGYVAEITLNDKESIDLTDITTYSLACSGKATGLSHEVITDFDIRGVSFVPEIFIDKG